MEYDEEPEGRDPCEHWRLLYHISNELSNELRKLHAERAAHFLEHAVRDRFLGVLHKRTIQLLDARAQSLEGEVEYRRRQEFERVTAAQAELAAAQLDRDVLRMERDNAESEAEALKAKLAELGDRVLAAQCMLLDRNARDAWKVDNALKALKT